MHSIGAFAIVFGHAVTGIVDHISIVARTAHHRVSTCTAIQHIGGDIAGENVIERVAGGVDRRGALQLNVFDIRSQRIADRGLDRIGAGTGILVTEVAHIIGHIGVVVGAAVHDVGTKPAIERVVAGKAVQGIAFNSCARGSKRIGTDSAIERDGIDVLDGDRQGLGIDQGAVGNLDGDIIDIVATDVGGVFEVGCANEGQNSRCRIDAELETVATGHDPVGQRITVDVGGGDGRHRRYALEDVDRSGITTAVGGNDWLCSGHRYGSWNCGSVMVGVGWFVFASRPRRKSGAMPETTCIQSLKSPQAAEGQLSRKYCI